jgi:prepilin-type N-terminal cleavage/methylation domain-containing protein
MNESGFTLIEFSIALVIIGLVIGGILLGRDLISIAAVRAQVSQIGQYSTALNAFRGKYGFLPGDMPPSRSAQLGFFTETGPLAGMLGHQDGDGLMGGGTSNLEGEMLSVWRHLSDAQMIDGSYGTVASGNPLNPANGRMNSIPTAGNMKQIIPPAKLGRGNYVIIFCCDGWDEGGQGNWMQIQGMRGVRNISGDPDGFMVNAMTPIEAADIDRKLDDGLPYTGRVRWTNTDDEWGIYNPGPNTCATADFKYDVGANGNTPLCGIAVQIQQ